MLKKVSIKSSFILIFNIIVINQSHAACTKLDTPAVSIMLDMGSVVVSPNLNVGDIIAEQSFPIAQSANMFYCYTGDQLEGLYNSELFPNSGSNKIYPTNIEGIGIQILRESTAYPYTYTAKIDNNIYLSASTMNIKLYKTAEFVGAGSLSSGNYTYYGPKGAGFSQSGLNTYMTQNGTRIVTPSCSIISGAQQNVYLEKVNIAALKSIGNTAGDTAFTIQLKCNGGASLNSGFDNVSMTFSGNIPASLSNADGILLNDAGASGATGVGIQILSDQKKPIEFEKKYSIASLATSEASNVINSNYTARYYRYDATMTPGIIEAKMIFNINYD